MAVAYRSSSVTGTSDAFVQSVGVPVPSGVVADDIILVALEMWESTDVTVSPPSGFTLLFNLVSGSSKLKVFWKRATGADSGSYTFTWVGNQWTMGHAVAMSGAKTSGDPIGSNFNTATATSTTIPTTTVTTASFIPGLVSLVSNENAASTTTSPTGFTLRQDGDYLHSHTRIASASGSQSASGGVLSASTLILASLVALEPTSGTSQMGAAGTAAETDSALPLGKSKRKALGLSTSVDAAQVLVRRKAKTLGVAAQTGTALPLARTKVRALGTVTCTDTAVSLVKSKLRTVGTVVQSAVAQPLLRTKTRALGVASTSDTPQPVTATPAIRVSISPVVESTTAQPLTVRKRRVLFPAVEVSTAVEFSRPTSAWRLVAPLIHEQWPVHGRFRVSTYREYTVFGDVDGLFLAENGRLPGGGGDEWGAIPADTTFVWLGGHQNITTDPAVRALWLAHAHLGLSVEVVNVP